MTYAFRKAQLLRVFLREDSKVGGKPAYEWIVEKARDRGLAGATALRGIEGYGTHKNVHSARAPRHSELLPIVVEIVDSQERIRNFLLELKMAIPAATATIEKVSIFTIDPDRDPDAE